MKYWLMMLERYSLLSLREKLMLLGVGFFVVGMIGYTFMIEPKMVKTDNLLKEHERQRTDLGNLASRINELNGLLAQDPNAPLIARKERIAQQIADVDGKLRSQTVDLIPADKMSEVLQRILEKTGRVEVVALDTLPPKRMIDANDTVTNQQVNLFQHGVRLEIEGGYFDIQSYLDTVENLQWQFYWKSFDYRVNQHPAADLVLEIYTLSTSEDFIGV